jgi:hypothetical protein
MCHELDICWSRDRRADTSVVHLMANLDECYTQCSRLQEYLLKSCLTATVTYDSIGNAYHSVK